MEGAANVHSMGGRQMRVEQQEAEMERLTTLSRTRALTGAESDLLASLLNRERCRKARLHAQIDAARAKLERLEAMAA